MDRLLSMRVFQKVVEAGSFAAASRALDLSPAVVTRLVADLETSLGTRLLHRTTRKISLTEAGNEYGARLHGILQDIEEAEMSASAHSKDLQGTVRLLSTPGLASFFLAPNIVRWYEQHPNLALDIAIDAQPLSRLEAFDLAVVTADEDFDANVIARPLSGSQTVLCAAPAYLQRVGHPQSPADLEHHDYLRPMQLHRQDPAGRRLRLTPMQAVEHDHSSSIEINVRPLLRSPFDVLLRACLNGLGFMGISELLARPYLHSGELVRLLPDWGLGRVTIYAALPTRKFVPAKTRAMMDFLIERAQARR